MPIPFAALALGGLGAAAGAYGARQSAKAAEGQTEASERMRREAMQAIQSFGQKALQGLPEAYQRSQDIRQQSINEILDRTGRAFRPALEQFRGGNYMAQQRIAQAQPFMQSAILGTGSLGYMPSAQNVGGNLDYTVLSPLGARNYAEDPNPLEMQFTPVPGGQGQPAQSSSPVDAVQSAILEYQARDRNMS